MFRRIGLVAAIALAVPLVGEASAAPPQKVDVIVVLHDGLDAREEAHDLARSHDAELGFVYEHALRGFSAQVPEGRLRGLANDRRVDYVHEDGVMHAVEDTYPTGVRRVDADDLHGEDATATGSGVRVAVIDTGIDLDHPDLDANVAAGTNCVESGAVPQDDEGHGTHVAGTIAAEQNASQVVGVAPDATLVPVKVLGSDGSGTWSQVICGVDWVAGQNDIDVANMSLGAQGSYDGFTCGSSGDALFEALCSAVAAGTTFTVAAGNDGQDASGFVPAAHPEVVTVSAYSDTDGSAADDGCTGRGWWKSCDETVASFSNYGTVVDVIAPGVDILSTTLNGGTGTASGTSMAAPHAAGVAALAIQQSPGLTPAEVRSHLQATGQCPDGSENGAAGYCSSGSWDGDPDAPATEPMVNAYWAATATSGGDDDGATETAPDAPSELGATAQSSSQIDLAWTDNSDNEDGFEIERSPDGDDWSGIASVGPDETSYTDTGLAAETGYHYRVVAWNQVGSSSSNEASATTWADDSSTGITLDATASKDKGRHVVDLTWAGASGGVDVYRDGAAIATGVSGGSYTDHTGNRGSATYRYQVCPTGSSTGCSNTVTVTY